MGDITQRSNILHISPFYFNGDTGVTEAKKTPFFLSSDVQDDPREPDIF